MARKMNHIASAENFTDVVYDTIRQIMGKGLQDVTRCCL